LEHLHDDYAELSTGIAISGYVSFEKFYLMVKMSKKLFALFAGDGFKWSFYVTTGGLFTPQGAVPPGHLG